MEIQEVISELIDRIESLARENGRLLDENTELRRLLAQANDYNEE